MRHSVTFLFRIHSLGDRKEGKSNGWQNVPGLLCQPALIAEPHAIRVHLIASAVAQPICTLFVTPLSLTDPGRLPSLVLRHSSLWCGFRHTTTVLYGSFKHYVF